MEDRGDLDPAPSARRPAAAATAPPEAELGGPGTPGDPARRDTESPPPRAAATGHPATILRWHRDIVAAGAAGAADPVGALRAGAQLFLDACAEPEVERIILPGAPAVLGWQAWRDLAGCYGLGLIQLALQSATDAGAIVPPPVVPSPTS
jgi:hypothetical protein